MYAKMLGDLIKRRLSNPIATAYRTSCTYVKPGIYSCCDNRYVIALYKVKSWSFSVYDLSHLEYLYYFKRFLELFQVEGCRTIFFTDIEPVDVDKYMAKLNRKLQTKLVELELDKSNVKLQTYIERLQEIRKKVLMGIKPVKLLNIIALACNGNAEFRVLESLANSAKSVFNMDLEPIVDRRYAEVIVNFRLQ